MSGRQQRAPTTAPSAYDPRLMQQVLDAVNRLASDATTITVTSSYTVPFHTGVVYYNGGSAGTVFLPSGSTYRGAHYTIKNLSTHTMGIDPVGANIEGSSSTQTNTQGVSYTVQFDGSNYHVL